MEEERGDDGRDGEERKFLRPGEVDWVGWGNEVMRSFWGFLDLGQGMRSEAKPRAHVVVDGMNFWYAVRERFGRKKADFDILKLSHALCEEMGWRLEGTWFFMGLSGTAAGKGKTWHNFWSGKLERMRRSGVKVPKLGMKAGAAGAKKEKGVDVALAVTSMWLAYRKEAPEVLAVLSDDTDFMPLYDALAKTSVERKRPLQLYRVFPEGGKGFSMTGEKLKEISIGMYEACLEEGLEEGPAPPKRVRKPKLSAGEKEDSREGRSAMKTAPRLR